MLIFRTTPYYLEWAELNDQDQIIQSGQVLPEHPFPANLEDAIETAEQAAYLLENGGPELSETATELTPGMLSLLQNLQKYAPYENTLLMNTVFQMVTMRPDLQHTLLCNTAFFQTMPLTARTYALPKALRYPEIQRHGSDGIFHQFASQQIRTAYPQKSEKIITIYLDKFSVTLAAIQRGLAVECSSGFSKLEGIPGLSSVGSTDPSLPLLLCKDGLSVDQALHVLTTQSGFQAINPSLESLYTLYHNDLPEVHRACRERLQYHLRKQIGSGVAVLNGVQQLLFITPALEKTSQFLMEMTASLSSLGASCRENPQLQTNGLLSLTTPESKIEVHALEISSWAVLAALARSL
jgi:acetate kinase